MVQITRQNRRPYLAILKVVFIAVTIISGIIITVSRAKRLIQVGGNSHTSPTVSKSYKHKAPIISLKDCHAGSTDFKLQTLWKSIDEITSSAEYKKSKVSGGIFLYPRQTTMITNLLQHQLSIHGNKQRQSDKGDSRWEEYSSPRNDTFRLCETGFGARHSTALFLHTLRSTTPTQDFEILTFDKFDRPYQKPVLDFLKKNTSPGKLVHIKGNSCKTVPATLEQDHNNFSECDFLHGSSLCPTDNIDLVRHAKCGAIVTSTAMHSLSDKDVYFGPKAQWRKLREQRCIDNITCFGEEKRVLKKSFVFANKNDLIAHEFCFARVTGSCHYKGKQSCEESSAGGIDALRRICLDRSIEAPE